MQQFDVAVIGAGLAGLESARQLALRGRSVLLVDAKETLSDRIHTTGIFVRRTLEDFHLPQDCLGPPVSDVSLYSPNGRKIDLHSPHVEYRVGRMARLYSHWLNQCRELGVVSALETKLVAIQPGLSGNVVELKTRGRTWHVDARFAIGADGACSTVAGALALSENKEWIVGVERIYSGIPINEAPRFHCLIDPVLAPGYIAWIVQDGSNAHVGVGGYPNRFEPLAALKQFEDWAAERIDFSRASLIERRGGRIPVGGLLPNIINERGLLVGDAAGAVSPLTAGGLDPCFRLSVSAAEVIDLYLRTNDPRVLASYNGQLLRRRFWKRLILRRAIQLCRSRSLIDCGWWLLASPFGRAFARKLFFGRGSFPDLALPEPLLTTT